MTLPRRKIRSPYMEWAKLHSHARFGLAASDMGYLLLAELPVRLEELELSGASAYGYPPLQERLASYCGVPQECVVAANGASMANHLAIAALIEPGDEVLIEQPTYELLLSTARFLGASIRRFPRRFEDAWAVDPDAVARAVTSRTRLIVVTNLHNPSGVRAPQETLARVADVARQAGARLLVDEVYLEGCRDEGVRSAFRLGPQVVVTSSLTKAYGLSGLRCGWVLAEPALAECMWRLNDLFGVIPAHPAERLSILAFDHLPKIAARARDRLKTNRAFLHRFLDTRDDLAAVRPEAGTIIFPRLLSASVEELTRRLRDRYDTSVVPGHFFDEPTHFRIGIGAEPAIVEEGLSRLGRALDDMA